MSRIDADAATPTEPTAAGPTEPRPDRPRSIGLIVGIACVVLGLGLGAVALFSRTDGSDAGAGAGEASTSSPVVSDDIDDGTTAPTTAAGVGGGTVPERDGRSPLRGFGEVEATITSGSGEVCRVCLLSATTSGQRARGLMEVTDEELGGYDGMLFEYPGPIAGAFWMRNTPMPLSIAYFDAAGELVSTTDMEPCADSPQCPSYPADQPFAYAIEVPQGLLDELGVTGAATLQIDGRRCPLAASGS